MTSAAAREERPVIWLQEGIRADDAVARARAAGLTVVQDLCSYKVHRALQMALGPAPTLPPPPKPPPLLT